MMYYLLCKFDVSNLSVMIVKNLKKGITTGY